ncbi:MAG: hypothetical protein OEZ34_03770 [Spirochaetia bacterium]|nr:hypothetical protein [Spirochaetia bacterium]
MSSNVDFDKRISVLENSMEWAQGSIQEIKRDLESLKNGQFQIIDRMMDLKTRVEERFSSQQAHTDERISGLQAHTDEKFIEVHKEIASIHRAISAQTKWILITILAAASIASILHPLMTKLI